MVNCQQTIKNETRFRGVGLHSGQKVEAVLKPAPVDSGIVFVRTDVSPPVPIPALNSNVVDTRFSTTLGKGSVVVATVEHLMSVIWGLGIDNLIAEVNGPEIPILDGSGLIFAKKIRKAGIKKQIRPRRYFVITKPVSVTAEDERYGYLLPSRSQKFTCSIQFHHPLIQRQSIEFHLNEKNYYKEIARARTFGFLKDVERLRQKGLISGGSLANAIVLDDEKVLNQEGLRFQDEFVRHKVLDTIGDVALMGMRILGHFMTHKAGHELHYRLIQKALIEECGYILGAFEDAEKDDSLTVLSPLHQLVSA